VSGNGGDAHWVTSALFTACPTRAEQW
jgi:hypothetical protein